MICQNSRLARLRLTPFGAEHLERTRLWHGQSNQTETFQRQQLDQLADPGSQYLFAIVDRELGHVGNLGFTNIDRQHGRSELWSCIGEPLAADPEFSAAALNEALGVGFEQIALAEIYVRVDPRQVEALRMYEEAGFVREATPRHEAAFAGEGHELVRISLVERKWKIARGLGPRVVLMQPHFLPWLGYLELIYRADVFVFLDDFQVSRQSWGQRNRLVVARGKVDYVTLPIQHKGILEATFLEVREAETAIWRRKLRNLLTCNYRRAPYGDVVLTLVSEWLAGEYSNIAELEIAFIERVAAYLKLQPRFLRSSRLAISGLRRSWRVQALLERLGAGAYISPRGSFPYMKEDGVFPLAALPTYFQNHIPRPYAQHASDEFAPRLSCLDALANLAPTEVCTILQGTDWWQSWEERSEGFQQLA